MKARLWWVLPFGVSLLLGMGFVCACALLERSGYHPDFTGRASFIASAVAVVAAVVAGMSGVESAFDEWAERVSPGHAYANAPVLATCLAFFAVPPTVTWVALAALG